MNGDKYISILIVIDYIITTSAFTETDSEIFVSVFVIIHSANLNLISISTKILSKMSRVTISHFEMAKFYSSDGNTHACTKLSSVVNLL